MGGYGYIPSSGAFKSPAIWRLGSANEPGSYNMPFTAAISLNSRKVPTYVTFQSSSGPSPQQSLPFELKDATKRIVSREAGPSV